MRHALVVLIFVDINEEVGVRRGLDQRANVIRHAAVSSHVVRGLASTRKWDTYFTNLEQLGLEIEGGTAGNVFPGSRLAVPKPVSGVGALCKR